MGHLVQDEIGKRGLGTVLVVIALIITVTMATLTYLFLIKEDVRTISLAAYPGAMITDAFSDMGSPDNFLIEWSGQQIPSGVEVKGYKTTDSFSSVMEWYRAKLLSEGWTILFDNSSYFDHPTLGNYLCGAIICKKGDQMAGIVVVDYQDTTYFALATAQKEIFRQWVSGGTEGVETTRMDIEIYAGLINENVVRFRFHYLGTWVYGSMPPEYGPGPTILNPIGKFGGSGGKTTIEENELYGWTFTNPNRFATGDWGQCELQLHGAGFRIGDAVRVEIFCQNQLLYRGEVLVDNISRLPG